MMWMVISKQLIFIYSAYTLDKETYLVALSHKDFDSYIYVTH